MEWMIKRKKKDDELMHYGVKGQAWGKRQYQREDGSWTPEGLARLREQNQRRRARYEAGAEKREQQKQQIYGKRTIEKMADLKDKLENLPEREQEVSHKMFAEGLTNHFREHSEGTAIVRVGNEYIYGNEDQIKKRLSAIAAHDGKIKDFELLDTFETGDMGGFKGGTELAAKYVQWMNQEYRKSKNTDK